MKKPERTGKQQRNTKFRPGKSGNPKGRPPGTLNKTTILARSLMEDQAEHISKKCINMALAGDFQAINLILAKLIPNARESPLSIRLTPPTSTKDIPRFTGDVLKKVGAGTLLPGQGEAILRLVKTHIAAIELSSLEERIEKLENKERIS